MWLFIQNTPLLTIKSTITVPYSKLKVLLYHICIFNIILVFSIYVYNILIYNIQDDLRFFVSKILLYHTQGAQSLLLYQHDLSLSLYTSMLFKFLQYYIQHELSIAYIHIHNMISVPLSLYIQLLYHAQPDLKVFIFLLTTLPPHCNSISKYTL